MTFGLLLALAVGLTLLFLGAIRWSLRSGARSFDRQMHWIESVLPAMSLAQVEDFLDAMIAEGRASSSAEAPHDLKSHAESVRRFQRRYGIFRIERSGRQVSALGLEPRKDAYEESARNLVSSPEDGRKNLVVLMRDEDPPGVTFFDSTSGVVTMVDSTDDLARTAEDAKISQLPTIAHFAASLLSVDDFERWTERSLGRMP